MAASFATVEDVAVWLKAEFEPGSPERAQMQEFLGAISRLIRKRRPLIDEWIAAGTLDALWVRDVVRQVASRLLSSYEAGAGYESEQYPEWSYRLTKAAAAGLDLTDAELADLTPESEARTTRAFSIRPG
jgi:hypothetical protein